MTGFRLAQNLNAYSGGTVRDLHPVFYNPVELLPLPQALKRNINFAASIHDGLLNVKHKRKRRGRLYSLHGTLARFCLLYHFCAILAWGNVEL